MKTLQDYITEGREKLTEDLMDGHASLLSALEEIDDDIDREVMDWVHNVDLDKWEKMIKDSWKNDNIMFKRQNKPSFDDPDHKRTYEKDLKQVTDLMKNIDKKVKMLLRDIKDLWDALHQDEDFNDVTDAGQSLVQNLDDLKTTVEEWNDLNNELSDYFA